MKGTEKLKFGQIVGLKSLKLNIFRGKNIATTMDSRLLLKPHPCEKLNNLQAFKVKIQDSIYFTLKSLKDAMFVDTEPKTLKQIQLETADHMR